MTGSTQIGGQAALIYRAPRATNDPATWPPKYTKIVMTFADEAGQAVAEWAFSDSRRLARIKLINAEDPETMPPLSLLGRDPHLDMISVEELTEKLQKRKAPIKAIMLDQNGPVCGIGNWMIDEILYQARLHPSHTGSALVEEEIARLHHWIKEVTEIGVRANADHRLFPQDWLFSFRWSKGKKGKKEITLPDGTVHEITFHTVGGRTSAVVEALQILPEAVEKAINEKLALTARRKLEKGEKPSSSPSKSTAKAKGKRKAVEVESDEGEAQMTASEEAEAQETASEGAASKEESEFAGSDDDDTKPIVSHPIFLLAT